jgi:hypothetical protein
MNRCRKFVFFLIKLPTTGDDENLKFVARLVSSHINRSTAHTVGTLKVSPHVVPAYPFDDAAQLLFINAEREAKL